MTVFRSVTFILFSLILTSCNVTMNASNAKTSAGFVNSGLRTLGTFVIWDTASNETRRISDVFLMEDCCFRVAGAKKFSAVQFSEFSISVDGDLRGKEGDIKTAISNNLSLRLTDYVIDEVKSPTQTIYDYVNRYGTEKLNPIWLLDRAVKEDSTIRYALIHRTISAESAIFYYGQQVVAGTGKKISVANLGFDVNFEITNSSVNEFIGTGVPALFDIEIYKAILVKKPHGYNVAMSPDTLTKKADFFAALNK